MKRRIIRLMLLLCGIAAVIAFAAAAYFKGPAAPETWLVAAATLAVLTSLSSAWSAQITVEIQEDQLRPYILVYLDASQRYQLIQVRMKNVGRGSAFEISDHWNQHIQNHRGKPIRFATDGKAVSVLHPDQWLSKSVNTASGFYQSYSGEIYSGYVCFKDAAGRQYRGDFSIDPQPFGGILSYDEEGVRTHYEIQRIPEKLDALTKQLERLVDLVRDATDADRNAGQRR